LDEYTDAIDLVEQGDKPSQRHSPCYSRRSCSLTAVIAGFVDVDVAAAVLVKRLPTTARMIASSAVAACGGRPQSWVALETTPERLRSSLGQDTPKRV
jgi:hypothetical protein